MQRITTTPRPNWRQRVAEYGLTFHTIDGELYWDESAYYRFSAAEVDLLEDVTNELNRMCLQAAEHVIRQGWFDRFGIPAAFVPLVVRSWEAHEASLYGRFDLVYDGVHPPKMLEYNADTPTALLEASVIQWFWLQEVAPTADQFNSIHEKLLARMQEVYATTHLWGAPIFHFASVPEHEEDYITVNYLRDLAMQAGFLTDYLTMPEIGWNRNTGQFVDMHLREIKMLFKLYPWEWLVDEEFSPHLLRNTVRFFEPIWKMLLSNKALLPVLWELFPGHPNLLRAEWQPFGGTYARKPILAREGANVALFANGQLLCESPGDYTACPSIYQKLCLPPNIAGNYPVIGSWIIGNTACGIGIREDRTPITQNTSRFVPHLFE